MHRMWIIFCILDAEMWDWGWDIYGFLIILHYGHGSHRKRVRLRQYDMCVVSRKLKIVSEEMIIGFHSPFLQDVFTYVAFMHFVFYILPLIAKKRSNLMEISGKKIENLILGHHNLRRSGLAKYKFIILMPSTEKCSHSS